ncbi:hypothetical protein [Micromonospora sp. WMMD812]|nr:hypothetical protein [Micromonospora sp. WMMD812]WBB68218.1 hypothetical protein O7603_02240 [Micromonospora sp. WMMD812]
MTPAWTRRDVALTARAGVALTARGRVALTARTRGRAAVPR